MNPLSFSILADIDPTSQQIGVWVVCLFCFLKGLESAKSIFQRSQPVSVANPLDVRLQQEYVTRREFAELKSDLAVSQVKMEGLFDKVIEEIRHRDEVVNKRLENQAKRTGEAIEKVASGAYEGRKKIWDQVNTQRETLAALKATNDVAASIDHLADAIEKKTP